MVGIVDCVLCFFLSGYHVVRFGARAGLMADMFSLTVVCPVQKKYEKVSVSHKTPMLEK